MFVERDSPNLETIVVAHGVAMILIAARLDWVRTKSAGFEDD